MTTPIYSVLDVDHAETVTPRCSRPSTQSVLGAAAAEVRERSLGADQVLFLMPSTTALKANPVRTFNTLSISRALTGMPHLCKHADT